MHAHTHSHTHSHTSCMCWQWNLTTCMYKYINIYILTYPCAHVYMFLYIYISHIYIFYSMLQILRFQETCTFGIRSICNKLDKIQNYSTQWNNKIWKNIPKDPENSFLQHIDVYWKHIFSAFCINENRLNSSKMHSLLLMSLFQQSTLPWYEHASKHFWYLLILTQIFWESGYCLCSIASAHLTTF